MRSAEYKRCNQIGVLSFYWLLAIFLLLPRIGCGSEALPSEADQRQTMLVIGKVTLNPKKHYSYLKPIAEYAVSQMQDLGITTAQVLMADSNEKMIEYLKTGQVDWVTETPYSAMLFEQEAGAELLLLKWKKGVPEYYTIFFTKQDSGINSLADLQGRTVGFEDPGSTSAFLVPAAVMIEHGLSLVHLATFLDKPPKDKVGYVFTEAEINTSSWVGKGLIDAGAYNDHDWRKEDHLPAALRPNLKIFHTTSPFPRALEVVRGDLDTSIKKRLKKILLHAHEDPKARKALRAYHKTSKLEELSENTLQSLEMFRAKIPIIQATLN